VRCRRAGPLQMLPQRHQEGPRRFVDHRHLPFANHFIAMLPASGDAPARGDIPHAIGARVGAARPNSAPCKKRILGDLHHIASAIAELVSSLSIIPPMRSFDVPPKHSAPLTRGLFLRRSTSCVESRCLLSDLDRSGERLVPVRLIVKALLPQESCPFPVLVRHHQEHRPFLHSKADSCDSHHSASATPALIMCSSHGPQNCGKLTTHPFDGSKPNSAPPRRGFSLPPHCVDDPSASVCAR